MSSFFVQSDTMAFAASTDHIRNHLISSTRPEEPLFPTVAGALISQPNASQSMSSSNHAKTPATKKNDLQFINISNPKESREKDRMKIVRSQAMRHTINQNQKPGIQRTDTEPPTNNPTAHRTASAPKVRARNKKPKIGAISGPLVDLTEEPESLPIAHNDHNNKGILSESQAAANSAVSRRSSDSEKRNKTPSEEDSPHLYHPPQAARQFELDPFSSAPPSNSPIVNTMKLKRNFVTFFGSNGLMKCWGPIAAVDRLFFLSSLCIAARHTDILLGQIDSHPTISLENEVVVMVQNALSSPEGQKADSTIAGCLFIACANMYSTSEQANMVQWYNLVAFLIMRRGGLEALRPGEPALAILILINALTAPLVRETEPKREFLEAAKSMLNKLEGLPVRLESPLCYPRTSFKVVSESRHCSPKLLSLLVQMRHVSELFIADGPTDFQPPQYIWQRDHIQSVLEDFPSATATGHETSFDFYYESCRIAALIQECALYNRMSFADVGMTTDYVSQLQSALKKTKLEDCWDDMAGVLLWVLLIGACAANRTPQRLWIVATMVRVNMKVSFEYGDLSLKAVYKLLQMQNFNVFKV